MSSDWISTAAAARMLCCSTDTVRLLIRLGRIPGWRMDERGHWRVPRAHIERMVRQRDELLARERARSRQVVASH